MQSSNANIALIAMQQLHLQQHAKNKHSHQRQQRIHDERTDYYAQPFNSDHLQRQLNRVMSDTGTMDAATAAATSSDLIPDSTVSSFHHDQRISYAGVVCRSLTPTLVISTDEDELAADTDLPGVVQPDRRVHYRIADQA